MEKLTETTSSGKPRCQARIAYGNAWTAGRKQCSKPAKEGDAFCHAHLGRMMRVADLRKNK